MSFIDLLKYIFLGLIQGFTKVLPISSSGHVAIFQRVLNLDIDQSAVFLALMNFGSLIAVVVIFRKFILELVVEFFKYVFKKERSEETKYNFHYVLMLALASLPIAVVGYTLQNWLSEYFDKYALIFVGLGSLIGATFLYVVRNGANQHVNQTLTYKDAFIIGILQPFSAIPGLSRFALTTSTGLLRKVSMDTALRFSIFLYIPISIGSVLGFVVKWIADPSSFTLGFEPTLWFHYLYYIVAFLTSIVATAYAIKWVFIWFRRGRLMIFAIYSMVLGFIALIAGLMFY